MKNLDQYQSLTTSELSGISGGGKLGWVGLAQPIYDFARGVWKGFYSSVRKHK